MNNKVTMFQRVDDVNFISRVKKILEKTGEESQSDSVVCELLWKIESMELTVEILEATMIGKTVNALKRHHASEEVRKIAATLVKQWKGIALKEWSKKQSNKIVEPATSLSQQVKPTKVINKNMEIRNKVEGHSEKASKSGSGGVNVMMDSFERPELLATKSLQLKSTNVKNINMKREKKLEGKSELRASKIGKGRVNVMMESFKKPEATKRKLVEQQRFEFDHLRN